MSTPTLYQIGEDMNALEELLDQIGGDLSDEQVAEAIDKWLQENEHQVEAKLAAYARLILDKQARAKARREEAARLAERARIEENGVKRLNERLQAFFLATGLHRVDSGPFTFTLTNNGGVKPLLIDEDALLASDDASYFTKTKREPDKDLIREALEQGNELPFARLGDRGKTVRIR